MSIYVAEEGCSFGAAVARVHLIEGGEVHVLEGCEELVAEGSVNVTTFVVLSTL